MELRFRCQKKLLQKKNQKLIITILDEFIEEIPKKSNTSARGSLAKYANTALWEKENTAWEDEMEEKHGNT